MDNIDDTNSINHPSLKRSHSLRKKKIPMHPQMYQVYWVFLGNIKSLLKVSSTYPKQTQQASVSDMHQIWILHAI